MTEYNEDLNENEDDGIFIISQKFQEVSNQGLGRFNRFGSSHWTSVHPRIQRLWIGRIMREPMVTDVVDFIVM